MRCGKVRPLIVDVAVSTALSEIMRARESVFAAQTDEAPHELWQWWRATPMARAKAVPCRHPLGAMDVAASAMLERVVRATEACAHCGTITFASAVRLTVAELLRDARCIWDNVRYAPRATAQTTASEEDGAECVFEHPASLLCSCAACGACFCCADCLRRHTSHASKLCPPLCPGHVDNWRDDVQPAILVAERRAAESKRLAQNQRKRAQRKAKKQQALH